MELSMFYFFNYARRNLNLYKRFKYFKNIDLILHLRHIFWILIS